MLPLKSFPFRRLLAVGCFPILLNPLLADEWPFTKSQADGMLWFWETQDNTGEVVDEEGRWVRDGELLRRGDSRLNWFQGASLHGGFLEAPDLGPTIAQNIEDQPALSFEMALHPATTGEPKGTLVWLGTFSNDLIWKLSIEDGTLTIKASNEEPIPLGPIDLEEPRHLAVDMNSEVIQWWVDGQARETITANALPTFEDPWDVMLTFGGIPEAEASWNGDMEFLAVRNQPHTASDSFQAWQDTRHQRTPPEIAVVQASLVTAAKEPDPSDISEYGEGIFGSVWEVTQSLEGNLASGNQILVWNWYILDRLVVDEGRPPSEGSNYTLRITPMEANPQVQEVQQIDTNLEPDQLLLLDSFFLQDKQPLE